MDNGEKALVVEKKHLVLGIDPGTTTGIAILGLDGKLLGIYSSRTMNLKDLIHLIIGHGYPLIVATDVSPAPAFVDRICRLFEAVLHQPTHSLTVDEKRELARSYSERFSAHLAFRNSHEKDAFAAAAKALESYGEKFRWIDKKLEERGLANISGRVKSMVVSGQSLSDSLAQVLEEKKPAPKAREGKALARRVEGRDETKLMRSHRIESSMIRNMEEEILQLRAELKKRELEIESLDGELGQAQSERFWEIVRSKEVDSRNRMILELKRSLSRVVADRERLRKKLSTMPGSDISKVAERIETMRVVGDLSKRTLTELRNLDEEGVTRFVLVEDGSGAGTTVARRLCDMGIEALIIRGNLPIPTKESLDSYGIPVIAADSLSLLVLGDTALADKRELEKAASREKKRMARRTAGAAKKELRRLVDDYRKRVISQK